MSNKFQENINMFMHELKISFKSNNLCLQDVPNLLQKAEKSDLEVLQAIYSDIMKNPKSYFKSPFKKSNKTSSKTFLAYLKILKQTLIKLFKNN